MPPGELEGARSDLEALLSDLRRPDGSPLSAVVHRPEVVFRRDRGCPPDLMAFFGDLAFRSSGRVGLGGIHTGGEDLGPDGCNHDWEGIFVLCGGGAPARGEVSGLEIYDVARTILGLSGVSASAELLGTDRSGHSPGA